ncbi:glycosyltransferase [Marixanthomonas ophiurae]|uniref:Glycosyltransferase n=1 Tax=Marixanthomonas ophiurae TaxID=387659 RepID=A0A3E1Q767_9FLAO|nr:glycosyltransferase [Marixanthomonas ophiurae]RFN57976.1 glycosyltransferase [Marixanthomonas ophiurae]
MIVILATQFTPAVKAGGPIKSLSGICNILSKDGYNYKVVTHNTDIDGSLLPPSGYVKGVDYLPAITIKGLIPYLKQANLIWINTLYSPTFSIFPLIGLFFIKNTTVLVSPRGQLLKGALSFKKRVYLVLFKFFLNISKHKIVIHFTNQQELDKSITTFKNFKTVIFNNPISGKVEKEIQINKTPSNFVLGFFGRVSPIKNIEFILKLLPTLGASFSCKIYGSIEDKPYKDRLDKLIETLDISEQVSFCGNYDSTTFAAKVQEVDLVVIPSFSENFCHVFFEAIEQRKIVIASDGLPWIEVNSRVKNTILALNEKKWVDRIIEIKKMKTDQYIEEQKELVSYYYSIYESVQNDTLKIFKNILEDNENKR